MVKRGAWLGVVVLAMTAGCRRESLASDAEAPVPPPAPSASAASTACGPLACRLFGSPEDAFAAALASVDGAPLVLAVGEAHAPKGKESIENAAHRFTRELLPTLAGRASDLLVELMMPPTGCKAKTADVRQKQRVVTEQQAPTNQGEYVAMGDAARKLGIVPDLLRPSCDDLDAVSKAGSDAVPKSLEMIARLATTQAKGMLARNLRANDARMIVLYGGALHNEPSPPDERKPWSFGPTLAEGAHGRYVAVELFVPEYIEDTESWRAFEWYPYFDPTAHPERTTLYRTSTGTFVLIFPADQAP
jgi:hypothetical protein